MARYESPTFDGALPWGVATADEPSRHEDPGTSSFSQERGFDPEALKAQIMAAGQQAAAHRRPAANTAQPWGGFTDQHTRNAGNQPSVSPWFATGEPQAYRPAHATTPQQSPYQPLFSRPEVAPNPATRPVEPLQQPAQRRRGPYPPAPGHATQIMNWQAVQPAAVTELGHAGVRTRLARYGESTQINAHEGRRSPSVEAPHTATASTSSRWSAATAPPRERISTDNEALRRLDPDYAKFMGQLAGTTAIETPKEGSSTKNTPLATAGKSVIQKSPEESKNTKRGFPSAHDHDGELQWEKWHEGRRELVRPRHRRPSRVKQAAKRLGALLFTAGAGAAGTFYYMTEHLGYHQ